MNFAKLAVAAIALTATPVLAQDADTAHITAGAMVHGPEGNMVGTIETVGEGQAILDTGTHKVPVPFSAIGKDADGVAAIGVTKAQLDSMIDQQLAAALAKRDAALVAGTAVMTADAQELGTIETVDGDNIVVIRGDAADKVTLLREYFDATDAGVSARLTMTQIDEAMADIEADAAAE